MDDVERKREAKISAALYNWEGAIVSTPSGDCPFKLKNTEPETIRVWANAVIRWGHQEKDVHYAPSALRYFLRTANNLEGENLNEVFEVLKRTVESPAYQDVDEEETHYVRGTIPQSACGYDTNILPLHSDHPQEVTCVECLKAMCSPLGPQGMDEQWNGDEFETVDQSILDDSVLLVDDDSGIDLDDSDVNLGDQFGDDYDDTFEDFRTIQRDNYHSHGHGHGHRSQKHFVPNRQTTTYYGREDGNPIQLGKPSNIPSKDEKEKDVELVLKDYTKPTPKYSYSHR